jgi:hypothetical protein
LAQKQKLSFNYIRAARFCPHSGKRGLPIAPDALSIAHAKFYKAKDDHTSNELTTHSLGTVRRNTAAQKLALNPTYISTIPLPGRTVFGTHPQCIYKSRLSNHECLTSAYSIINLHVIICTEAKHAMMKYIIRMPVFWPMVDFINRTKLSMQKVFQAQAATCFIWLLIGKVV